MTDNDARPRKGVSLGKRPAAVVFRSRNACLAKPTPIRLSPKQPAHLRLVTPLEPMPAQTEEDVQAWLKRLGGVKDHGPRLNLLAELIAEDQVVFGDLFIHTAQNLGKGSCRTVYLDVVRLLSDAGEVSYEDREKLYAHARTAGHPILRFLVLDPGRGAAVELEPMDDIELEDKTLGEKKALARTADLLLIDRLARDPDPRVIAVLLDHPRLTEAVVLKIATRRPVHPEALVAVVHHPRWGARTSAIEAVARNPHTPPGVAGALVPLLSRKVRRQILRGSAAHPLVRALTAHLEGDSEPLTRFIDLDDG